jgi:hypothetical protein
MSENSGFRLHKFHCSNFTFSAEFSLSNVLDSHPWVLLVGENREPVENHQLKGKVKPIIIMPQ